MTSTVYYGSPRQARLNAKETLPAKLDLILEALHLRDRVKDEMVCLKLHVGNNIGYSTIHPVFVRKVVQAIKDGGGKPFIADVDWDVAGCEQRGYTSEVLGCPVYPAAGPRENYFFAHEREYKNLKTWKVAGMVEEATFLVNFAHVKGHPATGFGGAFKNIALGCMVGETRSQMHDVNHYDKYWFKENCPDRAVMQKIVDSCPFGGIVFDKYDRDELHIHFEPCNQCGRCLKVAPPGSLKLEPVNVHSFMEACAISADIVLSTFDKSKVTHLALATQMTPVCDCFGFTSMPIMQDAGIFGSDDIVAIDTAVLDQTANSPLFLENLPTCMEAQPNGGHPFAQLHGKFKDPYMVVRYGEQLGLGSMKYNLVDVLPLTEIGPQSQGYYISAK
ncbi:MAG: DUF362 domain-containing protein [Anaerolineaceae bacterium]|nr:DUF362 domain-containing protein [Anaerolineaceae bacterium]